MLRNSAKKPSFEVPRSVDARRVGKKTRFQIPSCDSIINPTTLQGVSTTTILTAPLHDA